jgi:hypothetical protein
MPFRVDMVSALPIVRVATIADKIFQVQQNWQQRDVHELRCRRDHSAQVT